MTAGNPERWMREALLEAEKAKSLGEVPIGCVVVQTLPEERIVGRGHNRTETAKDPTAHAEILALREAAVALGGWRLPSCDLYVTVEPCSMCAGAIVLSRIENVYIGAMDPKAGACGSLFSIPTDSRLNHQANVIPGVLAGEASALMKGFFRELRQKPKSANHSNPVNNKNNL